MIKMPDVSLKKNNALLLPTRNVNVINSAFSMKIISFFYLPFSLARTSTRQSMPSRAIKAKLSKVI